MAGMTRTSGAHALALFCAAVLLAGCVPMQPVAGPAEPAVSLQQRWALVQEAGRADDTELDVQPLRDPQVEDLREQASRALAAGELAQAAVALDRALAIVADDPAVLQERAELALLQGQLEQVEALARKAYDLGSRAGPLCRRHWAAIEQSRLARGQAENAVSARAQLDQCTIPGVTRY
jgi:tetratricopeptide (TPR) repeat protein